VSFHDELIPLLTADLAQAFGVPEEAIYVGDRPQKVTRQGLEVWIEPDVMGVFLRGGYVQHPYRIHLRVKIGRAHAKTGQVPVTRILNHTRELVDRYSGERPFWDQLPSLVTAQADGTGLERDDEQPDVLDGFVLFRFLEA